MPAQMLRLLCLALCLMMGTFGARADDEPLTTRIAAMDAPQLSDLISQSLLGIATDTRRLRDFANSKSCLELYRAANSFTLGYDALQAVGARAASLPPESGLLLKAKATQARVIAFASRVRAAEWIDGTCDGFVVPADSAKDPRYAVPEPVTNASYTAAITDARDAADANFAAAIGAAKSGKCPQIVSSVQAIALLVPYLEKLYKDSERKIDALGPRASRRGLMDDRNRLVATANQISAQFTPACASGAAPPAAGNADPGAAPQP